VHRLPPLLAAVLVLAACAGPPPLRPLGPAPEAAAGDIRGEWLVTGLIRDGETVPLPGGAEGTLTVGPRKLSGTAFCNGFGGDYELEEGHLEVRELVSTVMACTGDVATSEGLYLEALQAPDARLTVQAGELVLTGDGVELRFIPRPPVLADDLVGTAWLLQAVTADGLSTIALGTPALLEFRPDGTFLAGTGCGTLSGTWDARPDGVSTTVDDHEADCAGELREQDGHMAAVFAHGVESRIARGRLILTSPEGPSIEYVDAAGHDAD
jgi:heat shock protein HslJ